MRIALTIGLLLGLFPVLPVLAYPAHSRVVAKKKVAAAGYTAYATKFTTDDYMTGPLPSIATNSKTGILSFWIKNLTAGTGQRIYGDFSNFYFYIFKTAAGLVKVYGEGASVIRINMDSTASVEGGAWHHVYAIWDTAVAANCKIYVDGVEGTTVIATSDANIDYNGIEHFFNSNAGAGMHNDICEFWFAPGQWEAANTADFAAAGKPISLGSDGSTPTGTAPRIYFKNPFSSFNTNSGTGGSWTVTAGTLETATPP